MEANAGSIGAFEHVAVVVRDLDRALAHYTNDLVVVGSDEGCCAGGERRQPF